MRYSLLAAFGFTPTLDDHLDNLLLLGISFLVVIFVLIVSAIILDSFSKACSSSADWLENKSAKRTHKHRRTRLSQTSTVDLACRQIRFCSNNNFARPQRAPSQC